MTEEIDSIAPIGASASAGFTGARVDVTHAPQPAPTERPAAPGPRPANPGPKPATPSPRPQAPGPHSPPSAAPGFSASADAPASPTAADGPPASASALQATSLQDSVERINARLVSVNRVLQLRVDAETGITIAEIKNSETGQVLQQIPSADVVRLAEMLSAWAHGKNVLIDLIA